MDVAGIIATSAEGQQFSLHRLLAAAPIPKIKSAREISLRAQLCDDWNMRQGGQLCQSASSDPMAFQAFETARREVIRSTNIAGLSLSTPVNPLVRRNAKEYV
jgi:hypothetical protein